MLTRDDLLAAMRERVDHPATLRELLQRLRIPREERTSFGRLIKRLVAEGALIETRGRHYGLPDQMDLVVGRLEMNPQGYGFVEPEREAQRWNGDVYVAGANLHEAMHGDRVVVRVERVRADNRAEGRILRILERRSSRIVGRFETDRSGLQYVVPHDRRVLSDILVSPDEAGGAAPGEMVTVEISRWPTAARPAVGRVVEVLGPVDAPGVDVQIVIRKYGIPDVHGDAALEEARRLGHEVRPSDLADRTDFRQLPTVTIDGEHARDFDDAITLERRADGTYVLGVHIADVAHYVSAGSPLDVEAAERGTSVYFPERAVHMFPAPLATGLCSLNPRVDRLVHSCVMEIDSEGQVRRYALHDGIIHSRARMTYTDVNSILTDRDPAVRERHADLVPLFELMEELFQLLNARRRRRGSIDFDLPEPEVVLDAQGLVERIIPAERNVAHRLIEEFMLAANEAVARYLSEREVPALYRIHEVPDPLKVAEFEEFVAKLGHSLGAPADNVAPRHFQRLVERIRGTPEERAIAFLMLRTMQKARYDPANLGHYGLATACYTHFTSPIRRYPDLVVHRLLKAVRHGELDDDARQEWEEALPQIARHTSEMERRADEAERELVQWKKVRFMADKVGDEFDGFVTGVAPFGLFVELAEHFVEGLVHVSSMADDYYRFLEREHELRGENKGRRYRLGDRVRVQIVRVDLDRRLIDLGLLEILDALRESEEHRGPRRSRARPRAEGRAPRPGRRERAARRTRRRQ